MVWRPENSDLYLSELYGDWRTPDPSFDGVVAAKNLVGLSGLTQAFSYNNIITAYRSGRKDKAVSTANVLNQRGDNHPVILRLIDGDYEK